MSKGAARDLTPDSDFFPSFFSLVTGCCYRLLENPTISHQKNRPTREAIAHLLGVALVRYNHMLSKLPLALLLPPALPFLPECLTVVLPSASRWCSPGATVKIIQMLQHFEHLPSVLVAAVSLWATDYGMKSIVGEIVRWLLLLRDPFFLHVTVASCLGSPYWEPNN